MELVPVDPAAVAIAPVSTGFPLRCRGEEACHVLVPRHRPQYLGSRGRALGAHEEPPEAGLRLVHGRQAPVVPQHRPELGVRALDAVVRRRPGAAVPLPHLDEREQLTRPDQAVQAVPCRSEPLVHVPLPAVLDAELPQEPLPPRMPFGVRGQPCRGRPGVADLQQPEGDAVELLAAWELRPARGAPFDLAERVERAPLQPCAGPHGPGRLCEAGAAVGDCHGGRGDARHQRRPGRGALAAGQLPGKHVLGAPRHQHHRPPPQPDAVEVHDVADLARGPGYGPYPPELRGHALERRPRAAHVGLRAPRQQPAQEHVEPLGGVVDPAHRRRAAARAAPPPAPGAGLPVAAHGLTAKWTPRPIHGWLPSLGNFSQEKRPLTRHVKRNTYTLSEPPGS